MRRRIPYRVCQCMPNGVVTHLEARLLRDLVNREIHPIRCAESCKRKYQKGMPAISVQRQAISFGRGKSGYSQPVSSKEKTMMIGAMSGLTTTG